MAKSSGKVPPERFRVKRQKYWKELKQIEKIERMREIIKQMENSISLVSNRSRRMEQHTHNKEGEAVEVKKFGYLGGSEQEAKSETGKEDEVYF